jgi:hypothetical protein
MKAFEDEEKLRNDLANKSELQLNNDSIQEVSLSKANRNFELREDKKPIIA